MWIRKYLSPDVDVGGGAGGASGGAGIADAGASGGNDSPAPTMEDTARSEYKRLMGGESDATDSIDEQIDEPRHKSQPRDKGKFSKAAAAGEQSLEGQQQQQAAGEEGQQQQQAQTKLHDSFPNTWQKELQGEWAGLSENVRQQIHKREADFHNGVRQYKDAATFGSSIARELMPYQEIMRKNGVSPQSIVRDIMGSLNVMATGSAETKTAEFLKLAETYGIDVATLQTQRQRAPAGAAPDLSPVLQRVQQIETRITQADQEREQHERAQDEAAVNSFLNDSKNEHARTVMPIMSKLLLSGQAETLQDAYEKAIWIDPQVRQKLLEKQDADRRTKEAEQVAAAKKAAAANVTRRGTPPTAIKHGTMEDSARSVYRKHMQ